jgi:hypothetical protein
MLVHIKEIIKSTDSLQNIYNIRKPILSLWKRKLNERKQSFWNYLRFQNTSVFYETWLDNDIPVLPNKFRPKLIFGEHEDDSKIRRENAVRNFEVEITLLKLFEIH